METTTPQSTEKKAPFVNQLYSTDSLTTASGFIHEIKTHEKDNNVNYFVRVSIITGTEKNPAPTSPDDEYTRVFQSVDLLAGRSLGFTLQELLRAGANLSKIRVNVQIRNLRFQPGIHEGKPVLNSRGILETITFGILDA